MFLSLLLVTFLIALVTSFAVSRLFHPSILAILSRIVPPELSGAWLRYLVFAIHVVGVAGGVRIWELEKYITPDQERGAALVLNADRWVLEVYRTLIGALQSIAWMLLVFFAFALVAYVIVRASELRREHRAG